MLIISRLRRLTRGTEFTSGDPSAVIEWDYGTADGVAYHNIYRQTQTEMTESNQQANWGNWYWSTAEADGVSSILAGDMIAELTGWTAHLPTRPRC